MATHEILYINKEGETQRVYAQSIEEANDLCTILERNEASYTIEDIRPSIGDILRSYAD